jgi:hypothetical protein
METEQMMAHQLAEIRTNREEMKAYKERMEVEVEANKEKVEAL